MKSAKLKTLSLIFIIFFEQHFFAVGSDFEELSTFSRMSLSGKCDSGEEENDKQEVLQFQESQKNSEDHTNEDVKNKLERISSELFALKGRFRSLSESHQKTKFQQIHDAIQNNAEHNLGWLKKEIRDFSHYINTQEKETGNTLLHIATQLSQDGQSPNFKILHYLLYFGANPELKNKLGLTPLRYMELLKEQLIEKMNNKSKINKTVSKALKFWDKYVLKSNKTLPDIDKSNTISLGNKFKNLFKSFKKIKISSSYDK